MDSCQSDSPGFEEQASRQRDLNSKVALNFSALAILPKFKTPQPATTYSQR
jgi:hypothetical protein